MKCPACHIGFFLQTMQFVKRTYIQKCYFCFIFKTLYLSIARALPSPHISVPHPSLPRGPLPRFSVRPHHNFPARFCCNIQKGKEETDIDLQGHKSAKSKKRRGSIFGCPEKRKWFFGKWKELFLLEYILRVTGMTAFRSREGWSPKPRAKGKREKE